MKVAILGTGDVGRHLAAGFRDAGHEVRIGTRDPGKDHARGLAKDLGVEVVRLPEASAWCDLAVLATAWVGTEEALQRAEPPNLADKAVLDATNPLDHGDGQGPPRLAVGHTDSAGEQVQRWLPDAHVVKCFNSVGHPLMVHPDLPGGPPTMFIAGDHEPAKQQAKEILDTFGWETADLGGIEASRHLEPLAMVWILHGFRTQTWNHAFRMLSG